MVLSLFLLGCSEEDKVLYETNNALLNQNNITDVVYVFREVTQDGETLFYGNRKGKDWFALFNSSGILQKEWYGKDRYYERPDVMEGISDTFGASFKKLCNGNYAYVYYFYPEGIEQAVYLCDNQTVEYGFVIEDEMKRCFAIEEDRFLARDGNIYDFEGNLFAIDCTQWDHVLCTGFHDDKIWTGFYDNDKNWKEAIGVESFERNRRIHIGYGEYKDYFIDKITIDSRYFNDEENIFETDWGFVFVSTYDSFQDVFCINNEKIYYSTLLSSRPEPDIRNWLDENILINKKVVLSPTAELISEFAIPVGNADEILSAEEGIRFQYQSFSRLNYAEGETIWETWIEKLYEIPSDARITMTIKDKGATLWLYHCDIVNLDGSRSAFEFDLNIETGEISYR